MATKYAGFALMAGMVLIIFATMLLPGNVLVGAVDQTDFVAARDALGDAPILAHWMTFLTIVSLLLMSFGLFGLYPAASRQAGLAGRLLQFGIFISVVEWTILIIVAGMRHFVIHLMQRSDLTATEILTAAEFEAVALVVHTNMTGIGLALYALFPMATILLGIGLAKRFDSMNVYKASSYVMVAGGVLGLLIFLIAMNAPDFGLLTMLMINNSVLYVLSLALIVIGYGMYRERKEFAP